MGGGRNRFIFFVTPAMIMKESQTATRPQMQGSVSYCSREALYYYLNRSFGL